jgi:hypothetical protein
MIEYSGTNTVKAAIFYILPSVKQYGLKSAI